MKKIIFLFVFLLLNTISFSQSRLGYSESQIRTDFKTETFKSGYTDDGLKYIYFTDENVISYYYFNNEGICQLCALTPLTQGVLNWLVERYNKNYVIIDDTHWKMYSENGILYINLVSINNIPTFVFQSK